MKSHGFHHELCLNPNDNNHDMSATEKELAPVSSCRKGTSSSALLEKISVCTYADPTCFNLNGLTSFIMAPLKTLRF